MGDYPDPQSKKTHNLRLRVIQADYGDCLILEADAGGNTSYILIDGGPDGVYDTYLKPELEEIVGKNGRLDLVVLSHVDEDHVVGLVDLLSEVAQAINENQKPVIEIGGLWYNTFHFYGTNGDYSAAPFASYLEETAIDTDIYETAYSITQGENMWKASEILELPLNHGFPAQEITLENSPCPLEFHGLKLWILGPSQKRLERFRRDWQTWYNKHKDNFYSTSALEDAVDTDNSVSNLSSIMFLAERPNRRILLTGDGLGEDALNGLKKLGLTGPGGKLHVDVLKVPHHGSSRNSTRKFYQTITADTYVIPAGKHKDDDNPDLQTLIWIVTAARKQKRQIKILVANPNKNTEVLVKQYPSEQYGYHLTFLDQEHHSITV